MMAHEFHLLRRILKERSGIELGADKADLVEAKLRPLLKEFGFPSFSHLTLALMKPDAEALRSRAAQAIAVQESQFFRDKSPFEYFSDVMLPGLMERRRDCRRIRIWSAAAATGQEPYSLAMLIADNAQRLEGWRVEIVATDFVEAALARARKGVFSQFEVQRGLPVSKLVRYFQKAGSGWEVKPEIRDRVNFRTHNLLDDCQGFGTFDVIFCRNVLIYFGEALKREVLARLAAQLAPDGYLVLGAAETPTQFSSEFTAAPESRPGVFCFAPGASGARGSRAGGAAAPRPEERAPNAPGAGSAAAGPATIELDRKIAALLEVRAKARGLTVAELLTEFAMAADPNQGTWRGLKAG